jgi:translation initiation factor IF-2
MPDLPAGTVTLLFADIERSTVLLQDLGAERYGETLRQYRRLLRDAVAEREGVEVRGYSVIYKVLDDLRAAMEGMLEPDEIEETLGHVEVRQIFRASRIGVIAGSYVTDGLLRRGARVRLVRDGTVVYTGTIASLRRFNDDVREVQTGFECGVVLHNFQDVKEGDVLEAYDTRQVERELS